MNEMVDFGTPRLYTSQASRAVADARRCILNNTFGFE